MNARLCLLMALPLWLGAPVLSQAESTGIKLGVVAGNRVAKTLDREGNVVDQEQDPGAYIEEVFTGSIAAKFELKPGDFIRGIVSPNLGKRKVDDIAHLLWVVSNSEKAPTLIYYSRGGILYRTRLVRVEVTEKRALIDMVVVTEGGVPKYKSVTKYVDVKLPVEKAERQEATEADLRDAMPAR